MLVNLYLCFMKLKMGVLILLVVSGCSNKIFKPLYVEVPKVEAVPAVDYLPKKTVPSRERKQLFITLYEEKEPDTEDYFNNLTSATFSKPEKPSVIIAVPEEAGKGTKEKEFEEDDYNKIFRTSGYYNEAEQAIEKSLLRVGFDVLDRSKFEAKLRDLRDQASQRPWYWNDWTEKYLRNGDYDIVKEEYKRQYKEGEITIQQYSEVMDEIDKISKRGMPGKKREEDEMNDIAEVIRAAQTGTERADYLLQINEVSVADAGSRSFNITQLPEVQKFLEENEGLSFGNTNANLPTSIYSNWLRSEFNAKLIDIATGSIVWLGSHELESWSAEEITITFDVQKFVNNEDEINGEITAYNAKLQDISNRLETSFNELNKLYEEAQKKEKFKSSAELEAFTVSLKTSIKEKEEAYAQARADLQKHKQTAPSFSNNPWRYSYSVSSPIVEPNLLDEGTDNIQEQQRLIRHKEELIKQVTDGLIKTISKTSK
jgi:hypothetical protein